MGRCREVRKDEFIVGEKFKVGEMIGQGSFGQVYRGVDITTGEQVAIKFARENAKNPALAHETILHRRLQGGTGVPNLRWHGKEKKQNVIVMDLLGPSLQDMFCRCRWQLSLKTVLMLADQMIDRVEYVHSKGYLHRDLKPHNFVMGLGAQANQVYIIDYGLGTEYKNFRTHKHIPHREDRILTGTPLYASIRNHLGIEQSRRDDLESLGYVILHLLRGSLPWEDIRAATKKKTFEKICKKKMSIPIEVLCENCPGEFISYFKYCRSLSFNEKPNYSDLKGLFRDIFMWEGYQFDEKFDWTISKYPHDGPGHARIGHGGEVAEAVGPSNEPSERPLSGDVGNIRSKWDSGHLASHFNIMLSDDAATTSSNDIPENEARGRDLTHNRFKSKTVVIDEVATLPGKPLPRSCYPRTFADVVKASLPSSPVQRCKLK